MKIKELLLTEEHDKDDEFPNLKDLSKHKYNLKLWVDESHLNKISDEEFSDLIAEIEDSNVDDFLVWHYWDNNLYTFDIAGTKGWQELADISKKLRTKLDVKRPSFFKSDKMTNINDLYNPMKYFTPQELKVKM